MPSVIRGQIVLVDFPYSDGKQGKIRPAIIVQSDQQNISLSKTIVALITGNLRRRSQSTHVFLDPSTHTDLGIHGPSVVSCINLFTIDQAAVIRIIGKLPPSLEKDLDASLGHALALAPND